MNYEHTVNSCKVLPTEAAMLIEIKKYFDGVAVGWEWISGRYDVTIRGHSFARVTRWIEIYISIDKIDVITRNQEALINAMAVGFAGECARVFDGIWSEHER